MAGESEYVPGLIRPPDVALFSLRLRRRGRDATGRIVTLNGRQRRIEAKRDTDETHRDGGRRMRGRTRKFEVETWLSPRTE
jgi:hypothetical protein